MSREHEREHLPPPRKKKIAPPGILMRVFSTSPSGPCAITPSLPSGAPPLRGVATTGNYGGIAPLRGGGRAPPSPARRSLWGLGTGSIPAPPMSFYRYCTGKLLGRSGRSDRRPPCGKAGEDGRATAARSLRKFRPILCLQHAAHVDPGSS